MKDTMALVFAYQNDEQMKALTQKRSLSSVPYGGRYRVVDFALSSIVNSGVTKVGVITRNNYQSLMDHVGSGKEWDLSRKRDGLFVLPPFSNVESAMHGVYRGKMEALMNAENFIRRSEAEYVILSAADSIFNLTFDDALEFHKQKGAEITILYKKGVFERENLEDRNCFIHTDDNDRVTDVAINPVVGRDKLSMGQFIINKSLLETLIWECNSYNAYSLHEDVLQKKVKDLKIFGYEYDGYYTRVDSIATYFQANMELLQDPVRQALFYHKNQIYTKVRDEVPTLYCQGSKVTNSLVADGCIIEGEVENCILFRGVRIRKGAVVKNSIIMQDCEIQANCQLDYTIADKDVVIRENRRLFGYEMYPMVLSKGSVV